jgi:hypothetical protein
MGRKDLADVPVLLLSSCSWHPANKAPAFVAKQAAKTRARQVLDFIAAPHRIRLTDRLTKVHPILVRVHPLVEPPAAALSDDD